MKNAYLDNLKPMKTSNSIKEEKEKKKKKYPNSKLINKHKFLDLKQN